MRFDSEAQKALASWPGDNRPRLRLAGLIKGIRILNIKRFGRNCAFIVGTAFCSFWGHRPLIQMCRCHIEQMICLDSTFFFLFLILILLKNVCNGRHVSMVFCRSDLTVDDQVEITYLKKAKLASRWTISPNVPESLRHWNYFVISWAKTNKWTWKIQQLTSMKWC